MEALEVSEMREVGEVPADDDSQQAAEAMVQLGNVGFYTEEQQLLQQGEFYSVFRDFLELCYFWFTFGINSAIFPTDESMDVDPNYDPSDFLLAGLPSREDKNVDKIQDDLAISESDDETQNIPLDTKQELETQPDEDDGGDLWF